MIPPRANFSKEYNAAVEPAALDATLPVQVSPAGPPQESVMWLNIAQAAHLTVPRICLSEMVPCAQREKHIATMDHVPLGIASARHCMAQVSCK